MRKNKTFFSVTVLLVLAFVQFASPQSAQAACSGIIYVDDDVDGGSHDGCSWATDFDTLQEALAVAANGDQIWVAQGTYKPTVPAGRDATFELLDNVAIYGGFSGTETSLSTRNSNPAANLTILSAEIGAAGIADNAYHVVTAFGVSVTTILDGFTITAGNANGPTGNFGGGMYIENASPTITNVIFISNSSNNFGGGVYVTATGGGEANPLLTNVTFESNTAPRGGGMVTMDSSPVLTNVTFKNNLANAGAGGGMNNQTESTAGPVTIPILTNVTFSNNTANGGGGLFNGNSDPVLTNVTFSGNIANVRGGAILNEGSSPTLRNVTISGNTAPAGTGGAIRNVVSTGDGPKNSNPIIYNSILWGDTAGGGSDEITSDGAGATTIFDSVVENGCQPVSSTCTNVLSADPLLSALASNGGFTQTMALALSSPAINTGNNGTCATSDQRGVTRPQGAGCDMGAYETGSFIDTAVVDFNAGTLGSCVTDNIVGDGALRLNIPSSSACVYESRIFNATVLMDWTTLTSAKTLPVGTSIGIDVRTGNSASPDGTWTNWQATGATISNPGSQYIQYRATLTTTDSAQTPVLEKVAIAYTAGNISALISPDGSISSWSNTFTWTGVNNATWYLLEVYTSTGTQLLRKWYTSAQTGCPSGTACALTVSASDLNLGNGNYQWRVMDYGAYGYGIWTYFKSFTISAACYVLTTNVNPAGTGSVTVPSQSCAGGYTAGSVVQVTAVPGTGYAFTSWSGAVSGTSNPVSVTMDGPKTVTANMRGNTPISPTGVLGTWNYSFTWTGLSNATWYLIEVQTSGGAQVFRKWYTSAQTGCSGGTACSVTASDLTLANGDYKWRVLDYGAYGYGINSAFKTFTLNLACYSLTTNASPGAGGNVNVPAQTCGGGYTAGSVVQVSAVPNTGYLFDNWTGDATGTTNPVSVTMNSNRTVTANFKATVVLIAPAGTLGSWNNTFSWTGLTNATWYLLEVYTPGGTQVFRKWYTSPQTACSGGTACSIIPSETAGLASGSYKWRILDYGAYGYGTWTTYLNFTIP